VAIDRGHRGRLRTVMNRGHGAREGGSRVGRARSEGGHGEGGSGRMTEGPIAQRCSSTVVTVVVLVVLSRTKERKGK
jgi:hypothetical protein